jgi:hypothetical protein
LTSTPLERAHHRRRRFDRREPVNTLGSILDEYAQGAAERLRGRTFCSLTVSDHGSLRQVASNDARAAACDQVEVRDKAGPCIMAMDSLHSVFIDDIDAFDEWPNWREAALDNGFRSFVALPAYVSQDVSVAANIYSENLATWTAKDFIAMDRYVNELAAALDTGPGRPASVSDAFEVTDPQ